MWNYRVARKRHVRTDPKNNTERVEYTYAIHEAYYDNNGYVEAITQDPIEPSGESMEELRHSWVMMAEAFGQPILDYDTIPELGYKREEESVGSVLDERMQNLEDGTVRTVPMDEVERDIEEMLGPFDEEEYRKQREQERVEKDRVHNEAFVGTPTLEELVKKLYSDYQEHHRQEETECIENSR